MQAFMCALGKSLLALDLHSNYSNEGSHTRTKDISIPKNQRYFLKNISLKWFDCTHAALDTRSVRFEVSAKEFFII